MSSRFSWNTGRYGYGKHLNEHGGGIPCEKLNRITHDSYQQCLAKTIKLLIAKKQFDEAFDEIMASNLPYKRKEYLCECLLPDFVN